MDFTLRCNSLKCRTTLTERAIVTTCSHIFCKPCSDNLGLTAPPGANRLCPACQSVLQNPDDVVSTSLNPADDYKTSVLSGLSPSTIMECAGRALAFWCYQSTQEIVYQEYLARTLTDKYNHLNVQMDRLVNEANSELEVFNQKLSNLQAENEKIRNDNNNLATAFREKSRKHQQTQELYDRLKRKDMMAATQSAAVESVDDVLGAASSKTGMRHPTDSRQIHSTPHLTGQQRLQPLDTAFNGENQLGSHIRHQRRLNNHHNGSGALMPPPPLRRPEVHQTGGFQGAYPSPSNHRIRIGISSHSPGGLPTAIHRSTDSVNGISPDRMPGFQKSSDNISMSSESRKRLTGYGMSAGMKIGRQQISHLPTQTQLNQRSQPLRQFTLDQQIHNDRNNHI